jgi:3-hydroxybutyryl-CoA dehydrogenase
MAGKQRLAVVGAGLMGAALARLFALAGWAVRVSDPDPQALDRVSAVGAPAGAGPLSTHRVLAEAVSDADLVIEAAPEKPALKQSLFVQLAELTPAHCILATNSSVIPVATVAARVDDAQAQRVIGTHFWNPPELIPLVEVIQGPRTALSSIETAMAMLRGVGKYAVHVRRDVVPGNRLQHALWREAMALVDEGVCTPEDIDAIVKNSFGLRLAVLGPLENADLVGLGLTADIHRVVLPQLSRATEPAAGLLQRVQAGARGVASGSGFYASWSADQVAALRTRLVAHVSRLLKER